MAYARKTWKEKMNAAANFHVEKTVKKFADIPAGATMLIATPTIVANYISNIPVGTETSLAQMRRDLAAEYNAAYCCPVTAGIFLRIVAEAAWEALSAGMPIDEVPPFWRMVRSRSKPAQKFTFGTDFIKLQRSKEGLPE